MTSREAADFPEHNQEAMTDRDEQEQIRLLDDASQQRFHVVKPRTSSRATTSRQEISACTVSGLFLLLLAVLNNAANVGRYRNKIQRIIREPVAITTIDGDGNEVVRVTIPKEKKHHHHHHHHHHHNRNGNRLEQQEQKEKQEKNGTYTRDVGEGDGKNSMSMKDNVPEKCSPWNISLDDWWQENPNWEVSTENGTHTCFRPIANPRRVKFLREVFDLQFDKDLSSCDQSAIRKVQDIGFAAQMLFHLNAAFWSAFRQGRRFQVDVPYEGFRWLYIPASISSWASCPTQDHECYFLPITNCPRPPVGGTKDDKPKKKHIYHEVFHNETLAEQNVWLSHYLMRPRQSLRHRLHQFMQSNDVPLVQTPCTWIHVRRADAMTESTYKRNFYPIQEYLSRGKVSQDDNILLLTDDQSALEEANALHSNYHWQSWNRTRVRGPVENNAHIPSGDPALEVLYILAERKLASRCQKGVHGNSNMATLFRNAMALEHGGLANISMVGIDGPLKKKRKEAQDFMKDLEAQLSAAQKSLGIPKPKK